MVKDSGIFWMFLLSFILGTASDREENHIDIEFITNTGKNLNSNEYHVIKVSFPSGDEYFVHLVKSDFVALSEEDDTIQQCAYSGSIFSTNGTVVGLASLSSCNGNNAFEGFLRINEKHFEIAPLSRTRRKRSKLEGLRLTFKYKAKSELNTSLKKNRKDFKRISSEKLEEARKQMIIDQEGLDDEDEEEDDDSGQENTFANDEDDANQIDSDNSTIDVEEAYAGRRGGVRRVTVVKRRARVIELAMFTDSSFYKKWQEKFPRQALAKIKQYLLSLVNNMNYLYAQPSLQTKISFRLVKVSIQRQIPSSLSPTTNSDSYLESFCSFQGKLDTNGAKWDHAMMITGLDMMDSSGTSGTIGLAFAGTMCLRYYSCSLVEFSKGFETAFTAAHEVGHSLGMDHDGETLNRNCDSKKYIMAARADSGQINWSKCSVANMKNFFKSGDPSPRASDKSAVPRCLTKKGSTKRQISYRTGGIFPGKIFSAKSQCQTACNTCSPYTSQVAPYNNICKMLYCRKGTGGTEGYHPALEGTNCGPNGRGMCRNGKCLW